MIPYLNTLTKIQTDDGNI